MKKKSLILPVLLFFSLLGSFLFCACDKDTNSYLDVLVLDEAKRTPVSGVEITISQEHGDVHDAGITGTDGIYSTHFVSPAILTITGVLRKDNGMLRRGQTTVRLKEGEVVTATVTLPTQELFN